MNRPPQTNTRKRASNGPPNNHAPQSGAGRQVRQERPVQRASHPQTASRAPQGRTVPRETPASKPRLVRQEVPQKSHGPQARRESAALRRRRHRHHMAVFYVCLFLAVLICAVVLSLTVLFKIDSVQVTGTSRYSAAEILRISGIREGENLFLADGDAARDAIVQKLPYIGTVRVKRVLPSGIYIEVQEDKMVGCAAYGEKFAVLGAGNKVLELADTAPEGAPLVLGLELSKCTPGYAIVYKDENTEKIYKDLAAAISESGLDKITKLDLTDTFKINVEYDGRVTLELGLPTELSLKLRFAKESILDAGNVKETERGVLNLSTVDDKNQKAYFMPDYSASAPTATSGIPAAASGAQNSG